MNLLIKIQQSIYELMILGSREENIIITTSFITERIIERGLKDYSKPDAMKLIPKIYGVSVSFNHFSNDIVIYDKTMACYSDNFKITIDAHEYIVRQKLNDLFNNIK